MGYRSWDDYGKRVGSGPRGALGVFAASVLLVIACGAVGISVIGYGLGWFSEAAHRTVPALPLRAALEKYEWFKDAAAAADAKRASIQVYEQRFDRLTASYGDTPRAQSATS